MRRTMLALPALALAGGCNPGDFAAALDRAPVQFMGAPDNFGSNVGRTLLSLPPPADKPKVAARLLFASTDTQALAVADFDGDGNPQVQTAEGDDLSNLGLSSGQGGISSAAWLNGPSAAGTIVLGMPDVFGTQGGGSPIGRVGFLNLVANASGKLDFESARIWQDGAVTSGSPGTQPQGHFGLALAGGTVTQAATAEVVVVSDNGVSVLSATAGLLASTTCTGNLQTPPDLHRSLAVANFLSSGSQQIAVGLPVKGGAGQVFVLQYDPVAAELVCVGPPIGVPNPVGNPAVGGFGTALVAVPDMNGDGLAELVVGAPPDRAYLFYSPFDGSTPPKVFSKVILDPVSGKPQLDPKTGQPQPDTSSEFGQRVALVDVDGDGIKELAITALQANVGGTQKAGRVLVYKLNGDGTAPNAIVDDSNPTGSTEFFGIGLADLEFNSSRACAKGKDVHLLVAGADMGIFTFFDFAGVADPKKAIAPDPRCFAQK
jgi:FG-GAP repeat